jgi:hypothetical protein
MNDQDQKLIIEGAILSARRHEPCDSCEHSDDSDMPPIVRRGNVICHRCYMTVRQYVETNF